MTTPIHTKRQNNKTKSIAAFAARTSVKGRKNSLSFKSIEELLLGVRRIGIAEDKNPRNKVRLETVKYNANQGQVNILGKVKPLTDKTFVGDYRVRIQLGRIGASNKKTKEHKLKLNDVYLEQSTIQKTPIKVSCTCKRFYYAWMFWDKQKKAFLGVDKAGPPQADPSFRVNKPEVAGMCKHVMEMIKTLRKRKIIK